MINVQKDSCTKWETFIVLGDFNATSGTDKDGYESCVGPQGFGSRDESSSILCDFAKMSEAEDRVVQNCRVFRSAEFAETDNTLLVAWLPREYGSSSVRWRH